MRENSFFLFYLFSLTCIIHRWVELLGLCGIMLTTSDNCTLWNLIALVLSCGESKNAEECFLKGCHQQNANDLINEIVSCIFVIAGVNRAAWIMAWQRHTTWTRCDLKWKDVSRASIDCRRKVIKLNLELRSDPSSLNKTRLARLECYGNYF